LQNFKIHFFILSIFSFHAIFLHGQNYYFKHFQVEQGLSNNTATCIIQDKKGFIWIGTKDGLNRFDGYNFKVFRNIPGDSTSLGNNSVWKLCEGKDGRIWVGTERGLYVYDPDHDSFSHIKDTPMRPVKIIAEDPNGNMWFIINFKLYRLSHETQTTKDFTDEELAPCSTLTISQSGEIWIATFYGFIGRYKKENEGFEFFSVFSHSPAPVSPWLEQIYDTGEGFFLIGTATQGIKKFDLSTKKYEDILIYNTDNTEIYARDFIKTDTGEYWIATESGIYIYNAKNNSFKNLKKDYEDPYALSDNAVYSFCKDKEGGIWIGTYFGGLNYMPKEKPIFKKFFPRSRPGAVAGNSIREITADDKGYLWIGTEDAGLNKFDPQTGWFTNFKPGDKKSGIAHTNIHGLLYDNNRLWIGTFEHGLDVMDLRTETVIQRFDARSGPGSLRSNFIHSLYKTSDNKIWVGSSNGIYIYNEKENNFISPSYFPRDAFYSGIVELSDGTILAGTFQDGLHYYSPSKNAFGSIQVWKQNKNLFAENRITYILESYNKTIWIATENGLYNIDLQTKKTYIYSDKTGLPSSMVYTIVEDNNYNKWITTSKGLVLMDKNSRVLRVFTKNNGLLSDQFNYSSCYKAKDGSIYMGSVKGMISFNPEDLETTNYVPSIYLTGISFFNAPLAVNPQKGPLRKSILITDKITLSYNQSTFHIDFAALNYTSPDNIEYAYKLEGADKDWNYIKTNRRVYFTNLSPGTYRFIVKSTDSNGNWAMNQKTLVIKILPPWWFSNLAYTAYILIGILAIYIIIQFYHNRQKEKQKVQMAVFERVKEKEMYESKIDFFTKIAHEIRTPLTLIKAPMEKIMNNIGQVPKVEKYLLVMDKNTKRLMDLTNQLLDFRKIESGEFSLYKDHINIAELFQNIYASFIPLAEHKKINFELHVPDKNIVGYIDEEATTKILSNLFDNAIKYSRSFVRALISRPLVSEDVIITISNDGQEIPEDLQYKIFEPFFRTASAEKITGTGIGLPLARSLAELQGGSLSLESVNGINTFTLQLPLNLKS
jgi:ligand-binding sensor domain-containing protein/signal transduction histidine kinase